MTEKQSFKKSFLLELLDFQVGSPCPLEDFDESPSASFLQVHVNDIHDNSRWSITYKLVFQVDDKYWLSFYRVGATEYQDERPWQFEGDMVDCCRVYPHVVQTTVYKLTP